MKELFDKNKKIKSAYNPGKSGQFSTVGKSGNISWVSCRETFESSFIKGIKELFVSHSPDNGEDIAKFLFKTEELLGIPTDKKTRYRKTANNQVLHVTPSKFWTVSAMRRSVLTIFLRAGDKYKADKDNYEKAILSQNYFKSTQNALIRFLLGFTRYSGGETAGNWVNTFKGQSITQLRKSLVRPKDSKEEEKMDSGIETLWS